MKTLFFLGVVFCLGFPLAAQEVPPNPDPVSVVADQESPAVTNVVEGGDAEQAEKTEPETKVNFFLETGVQYTEEGEYEEAERAYLRAMKKDPEDPVIRFRLSTLYLMMHRYKDAEPILQKLAKENPENVVVQNNLSWLYATGGEMRNSEKALRYAREAILSEPDSPSLWNTLAEGYYVAGQYDNALRSAEHALDLLRLQNASEETLQKFALQVIKIRRAQEALKIFEGTDAE